MAATFSEPQLSPFFPSDLCARLMSRRVCSHGGHRHELFMQGAGRVYVRGPARGQCRVDALARDEPRCYGSHCVQGVVRIIIPRSLHYRRASIVLIAPIPALTGSIEGVSGGTSRAGRRTPKWRAYSRCSSSPARSTARYGCVFMFITRIQYLRTLADHLAACSRHLSLQIVVVVWQIGSRNSDPQMRTSFFLSPTVLDKHTPDANSFWFKGGVLIEGCLVPLIVSLSCPVTCVMIFGRDCHETPH